MTTSWPFVGRDVETDRVESLLQVGTGALLVGESGIGKSALARHIGRRAARAGATVTFIGGHIARFPVPYEPFAAVLIDPGSHETRPLHPADIAMRVRAMLGSTPLLVLDDVHLLDDASGRVLTQLAEDSSMTLLMTAHPEQVLPGSVSSLWRSGRCQRIDVTGMSVSDVGMVLEAALDGPIDPRTVRLFARRTQGNALLLREMTITALAQGSLHRPDGIWTVSGDIPPSDGVRDLVARRLDGVDAALRIALETIAAGEPLVLSLATDVVGEGALEELEAARLVTIRDGLGGVEVSTGHPMYGDVIRAGMPRLRLRRLRLGLARAIEDAPASAPHDLVRAALWRTDAGKITNPDRLVAAARIARTFSLDTAERLARAAHEAVGSVDAALLLAEILTHTNRRDAAAALVASLPAESLSASDRDAVIYCEVMGQGLLGGDPHGAAELVTAAQAGIPAASNLLRALHSALLAFDSRLTAALDVGLPLAGDAEVDPLARTLAGIGVVGAAYWLGRTTEAARLADMLVPIGETVRDAAPFGSASMSLMAICALAEEGRLDSAERRAQTMMVEAATREDIWAEPRAGYCLGRVAMIRGLPRTAQAYFRRCIGTMTPFDRAFLRHLSSMLARSAAASGDVEAAARALEVAADAPRMTTYEPEWELAEAAVLAARLQLDEAVERAAWVAGVAAAREQWNVCVIACHDAARYGGAKHVLATARDAAGRVDGGLAGCYLAHVIALADHDGTALEVVSRRFEELGLVHYAAEAAGEAALVRASAGDARRARAAGVRFAGLRMRCEDTVFPWLGGASAAMPLTQRERQIARLAADGHADAEIAVMLGISARTVQTHLARVYHKLGARRRSELARLLD